MIAVLIFLHFLLKNPNRRLGCEGVSAGMGTRTKRGSATLYAGGGDGARACDGSAVASYAGGGVGARTVSPGGATCAHLRRLARLVRCAMPNQVKCVRARHLSAVQSGAKQS